MPNDGDIAKLSLSAVEASVDATGFADFAVSPGASPSTIYDPNLEALTCEIKLERPNLTACGVLSTDAPIYLNGGNLLELVAVW